jgi:hypothetical protein
MYYFHFDKGTVYLPHKKSQSLPVIVSTYGRGEAHWPKRVEEALRAAVNKSNKGFVTFAKGTPAEMITWVKPKYFTDPDKVGIFFSEGTANGIPEEGYAYAVVVLPAKAEPNLDTIIPTLYLQGTGEKVSLDTIKLKKDEIIRKENKETKSMGIVFTGSDDFLFNVASLAASETVKWLHALFTK